MLTVAEARSRPNGEIVDVLAVLTTQPGLVESGTGAFVQDATGGVAVYLATADWPLASAGTLVAIHGALDDRYAQRTIRLASALDLVVVGSGAAPAPVDVATGAAGEPFEGRLISVAGRVLAAADLLSDGFAVTLDDGSGPLRIVAPAASGLQPTGLPAQGWFGLIGPLGQRDSTGTGTAGYRMYLRGAADIVPRPAPTPAPTGAPSPTPAPTGAASPTPAPTASASAPTSTPSPTATPTAAPGATPTPPPLGTPISIAAAISTGGVVTIAGTVTTPPGFIDADARRVVVEDATGALIARLPSDATPPALGSRIVVAGTMGTYYGSPQLELSSAPGVTGLAPLSPRVLAAPPGSDMAWRLVRVTGVVTEVHRLGTTWRAELALGGQSVPIYGAARSGVPSTALVAGRTATVAGVVRPPYPTATDRRPAIAPRFLADLTLGAAVGGRRGGSVGGAGGTGGSTGATGAGGSASSASTRLPWDVATVLDIELVELAEHEGARVRVGGLVRGSREDRIEIDDGTASAAILLPPDALALVRDVALGDPLNAVGLVVHDGERWAVAPESAADIARVGRLGELAPIATPGSAPPENPGTAGGTQRLASQGGWPIGPLPMLVALAGTAAMVALRRREALELARRATQALPSGGPLGSLRGVGGAIQRRFGEVRRARIAPD